MTDRLKTVVDVELLQQWDSHRLCNPAATLSGFLNGVQHAASVTSNQPVRSAWVFPTLPWQGGWTSYGLHSLCQTQYIGVDQAQTL